MWRRAIIVGIVCIGVSIGWCRWRCPVVPVVPPPASTTDTGTSESCDCPDHIEVVIDASCNVTDTTSAITVMTVATHPGDIVIWNNAGSENVTVDFDFPGSNGSPFSWDSFSVPAGGQIVLKIREDAGDPTDPEVLREYNYKVQCGSGGAIGGPKVVVGGGGGDG